MRRWRALLWRAGGLLGFGRTDREIAEELLSHREMLAAEYRRAGMDDEAARRAASQACGSLATAERACRDQRSLPRLEDLGRDTRLALRSMRRAPILFISLIAVLALGVGFNTAIATVLDAVAWRPLPVPDAAAVVRFTPSYDGTFPHAVFGGTAQLSYVDFAEYREATHGLDHLAVMTQERMIWRRQAGARPVSAAWVSGDYFATLGVAAETGRLLAPADAREPVAVISHHLWKEAFADAEPVAGRTLSLDRLTFTVIGVAPESFPGTEVQPVDVWLPLEGTAALEGRADRLSERRVIWLQGIGRLAPRISLDQANAEARTIAAQLDRREPNRHTTLRLTPASRLDAAGLWYSHDARIVVGAGAVTLMLMLTLLLICGVNATTLLLARGASRRPEVALRLALGAGRRRLALQFSAEIAVILVLTTIAGAAVSVATLRALAASLPIDAIVPTALTPDARVLAFSMLFAGIVSCAAGFAPLRQMLSVDAVGSPPGGLAALGERVTAARLRRRLVAVQVAISVVLLAGAALLGRGVSRTLHVDPGYDMANLYIVSPDVNARPPAGDTGGNGIMQMRDRLVAAPGVEAVGMVGIAPFSGSGINTIYATPSAPSRAHFNGIDPHYFDALGLPFLAGRAMRAGEQNVVIVNTALADLLGGTANALGRSFDIATGGFASSRRTVHIVGIVPAAQTATPGVADEPTYYLPLDAADVPSLLVRTRPGINLDQIATRAARAVDPDAVTTVTPIDAQVRVMTLPARIGSIVAGLVALLGLLVASVGIHGIIAHTVTARIREIGVRVALGASRADVMRLVLGWTMRGVATGLLAGLALVATVAAGFPAAMRAGLFGLSPFDPIAFALVGAVLIAVTLPAAYLPARRALGIEPLTALRHD